LKCAGCGSVVEIVEPHDCVIKCGNNTMTKKTDANHTGDANVHLPVITETEYGYRVKIGEETHPMIPSHYIEFIELNADDKRYKAYLSPGDYPQFEFVVPKAASVSAREYCNLHGIWTKNYR
jgi:superoxide reductase